MSWVKKAETNKCDKELPPESLGEMLEGVAQNMATPPKKVTVKIKMKAATALPVIKFNVYLDGKAQFDKPFFFDARLDEYRATDDPSRSYTMQQMDDMIDMYDDYMQAQAEGGM